MPPKAKFTREEIINAALNIVREKGKEAVTARSLGEALGSSARPIFTVFHNMEEVLSETDRSARNVYNAYLKEENSFKGVGMAYIRFASEEPNLFRLLFMSEHNSKIDGILPEIDENYAVILSSVKEEYALTQSQAERFYRHLWTYSHGIATLCATDSCRFSEEEVSGFLQEAGRAFIHLLRGENK